MKKWYFWSLIVLIVGLVATAIGFVGHGNQTIEFENWHHAKIVTKSSKITTKTTKWSESDFNQINVDVKNVDVVVQTGDSYNVKFVGSPDAKFKVSKKDQTLTVKQTKDATKGYRMRTKGFFWIYDHDKHADSKLIITVPKDTQLSNVSINETNADLAGDLTLKNIKVDNVYLSTGVDINVNQATINGGQIISEDDIDLQKTTFNGQVTVNSKNGDIEVSNANDQIGYQVQAANGDAKLFDQSNDSGDQLKVNEDNSTQVKLTASNGDIDVLKGNDDND